MHCGYPHFTIKKDEAQRGYVILKGFYPFIGVGLCKEEREEGKVFREN